MEQTNIHLTIHFDFGRCLLCKGKIGKFFMYFPSQKSCVQWFIQLEAVKEMEWKQVFRRLTDFVNWIFGP